MQNLLLPASLIALAIPGTAYAGEGHTGPSRDAVAAGAGSDAALQTNLAGRGAHVARFSSQVFGESQNHVATSDGVRELQNRRVGNSYGPGSGR